jgi:hypothetical protein
LLSYEHEELRFVVVLALICCAGLALGQAEQTEAPPDVAVSEGGWADRFWLSGQANFIRQQHGDFYAAYSGPNSFQPGHEDATSRVVTLFTGFAITKRLEFLFDEEETGGAGLSSALGLAGFTNLDVVRNPTLGQAPYTARIMLHGVIALSKRETEVTRNPLSLASTLPVRRLELRLGKMSTVDFFDLNSVGSDSHTQFMNWAIDNNPAYDYAADTRGYTYGLLAEYYDRWGAVRYGLMLMPTVANGITLDWNLARARGENLEFELHPNIIQSQPSTVRVLSYLNHAAMGKYRDAINGYLAGETSTPDITAYRKQGRKKYGFGLNVEQVITKQLTAYGRLGWNDGRNESFAYTEVDRTAALGAMLYGNAWKRGQDKLGAAFVANGISGDHRRYLQLGGLGFLLGDGNLTYGLEKIFETYYTIHVFDGASVAIDWQHITDPGYNQVRGPVSVVGFRINVQEGVPFDKLARRFKR